MLSTKIFTRITRQMWTQNQTGAVYRGLFSYAETETLHSHRCKLTENVRSVIILSRARNSRVKTLSFYKRPVK